MAHDSTSPTATPAGPTLGGRSSFLPQWMRQSLEHLSMKTNMEEYGTSPPENESLFLHEGKLPTYSMATLADGNKKPDGLMFRARDLIVPRAPRSLSVAPAVPSTVGIATTGTSADQVCPSASAPQSAATTPTVTPQQSPTFFRKILANSDLGYSQCKGGAAPEAGTSYMARLVPVSCVTNFDLNAVSPTSW
ncbi:uncharacterized protein LOC111250622 [Varroa destructor]|uniref:Uncharacterized protein n=1 Tax=Varroa destructor TaxID=109461 RepID=A0A7M7K561_VARDE|nr:uncharacterized protein LOC111250622 [Varroa destructor]XP_022661784.1 uncharacterized protein LOC111250622 [Varroa destructor]XP_022661785.1 uncharacterized protein LOC111250622 [Varroa destructor]